MFRQFRIAFAIKSFGTEMFLASSVDGALIKEWLMVEFLSNFSTCFLYGFCFPCILMNVSFKFPLFLYTFGYTWADECRL